MIAVIGGAVGVVGGSGGVLGLWRGWRQEHREEHHAFFASYEKSIATLQTQYQRETDAAKKEEKRQRLESVENEYVEQQEAYRQNSALRQSAPSGVLTAQRPSLPDHVAAELTELLRKARLLSPAVLNAQDHLVRGNVLFELGRYEEALEEFSRSLELVPEDPATLGNRGLTLNRLKRHEEALAHFNRALELRPDDASTIDNRGIALLRLNRHEEALADFNRCLELKPDDPTALYNRACYFSLAGRYEDALADLAQAIARQEENRGDAREDEDFEGLRNHPEWGPKFWELVGTED